MHPTLETVRDESDDSPSFDFGFDVLSLRAIEAPNRRAFLEASVDEIGQRLGALCTHLHVRWPAEVVESTPAPSFDHRAYFEPPLRAFVTESLVVQGARARRFESTGDLGAVVFVAISLHDPGTAMSGAFGLVLEEGAHSLERVFSILNEYARFLEQLIAMTEDRSTRRAVGGNGITNFLSNAMSFDNDLEFAFALVNRLATKLGAEIVALGRCRGLAVEVMTISGFDTIRSQLPGVVSLQQAMEECLDCGEPVRVSTAATDDVEMACTLDPTYKLHQRWVAEAGGGIGASIPLRNSGETTHIISIRSSARRNDATFNDLSKMQEQLEPYAGALLLLERATRSLPTHVVDSTVGGMRKLLGRGSWVPKIATILALSFCTWFGLGTMPFQIQVEATVEPERVRHVVTPENGRLETAPFVAGDFVEAGDVLCQFETTDLELQRDRLISDMARTTQEERAARANGERVAAAVAMEEGRAIRTQVSLLDERIERLIIRAPYNARVVAGDLRARIGETMLEGAPLLQLAPAGNWRIELAIPETEVVEFTQDSSCVFSPRARPEEEFPFIVDRIRPSAVIENGENVYIGEAVADFLPIWIRPGMKGLAHVELGKRPVWWIAQRKIQQFMVRTGVGR